jgi:hypothetical protein
VVTRLAVCVDTPESYHDLLLSEFPRTACTDTNQSHKRGAVFNAVQRIYGTSGVSFSISLAFSTDGFEEKVKLVRQVDNDPPLVSRIRSTVLASM